MPPEEPAAQPKGKHSRSFNGCVRCKGLHAKCGEEKPSCSRCRRKRVPCVYRPKQVWMFESKSSPENSPETRYSSLAVASGGLLPLDPQLRFGLQTHSLEEQALASFFGSDSILHYTHRARWLPLVVSLPDKRVSLTRALGAVAVSRLARDKRDSTLKAEAHVLYHKALKSIQKELWDPNHTWNEQTMTAIHLMRIYECISGGSIDSVWTHAKGVSSYLVSLSARRTRLPTTELAVAVLKDAVYNISATSNPKLFAKESHPMHNSDPPAQLVIPLLRQFWPYDPSDIEQRNCEIGIARTKIATEITMDIITFHRLPMHDPSQDVAWAKRIEAALLKHHYRYSKWHAHEDNETERIYADVTQAANEISVSSLTENLISLLNQRKVSYELAPTLVDLSRQECRVKNADILRQRIGSLSRSSALNMVAAYSLIWTLFIPGRGSPGHEDANRYFSEKTGMPVVEYLDRKYLSWFWTAPPSRFNAILNAKDVFVHLWRDEDV